MQFDWLESFDYMEKDSLFCRKLLKCLQNRNQIAEENKIIQYINVFLTRFKPMFLFYTHWKHEKTSGFLMFSRGLERETIRNYCCKALGLRCLHRSHLQKQPAEVFYKKLFLKISQNSQENTCTRVSFLIKLQA